MSFQKQIFSRNELARPIMGTIFLVYCKRGDLNLGCLTRLLVTLNITIKTKYSDLRGLSIALEANYGHDVVK